ncbi:MAG TPA: proton-conducting transporter membrane subunit [Spirochaetia bacterium]|nr:proton-conducting transporter membrane subunit [Spirochaetia bacterium]
MTHYLWALLAYAVAGALALPARQALKGRIVSIGAAIGAFLVFVDAIPVLTTGHSITATLALPEPLERVALVLDPLSAFFAAIVAAIGLLAAIYGSGYLSADAHAGKRNGLHWLFFVLLVLSMLAVLIIQSVFAFLLAWELMSLSSFLLVIYHSEEATTRAAALNYLITMHIGLLLLAVGFLGFWIASGSPDFRDFASAAGTNSPAATASLVMLFLGFGLKAGIVPLHTWLPKAHPVAPAHVSGLMSGVMIKLGIYGILRMIFLLGPLPFFAALIVLAISILTAILGVLFAIGQHDMKRLLAYHSVENIGIIGIGIGIGMIGEAVHLPAVAVFGYGGALLHVLNHAVFKSLLFFGAGSVQRATGELAIDRLGGIAKRMPATAALFLIGSIAISGLPPFNGFVSEFLIYLATLAGFGSTTTLAVGALILAIASLALVGALALLCFTKVFGVVFLGNPRTRAAEAATERGGEMLVPMALLALLCILIGLIPVPVASLTIETAARIASSHAGAAAGLSSYLDPQSLHAAVAPVATLSRLLLAFVGFVLLALAARRLALSRRAARREETWGCGYPSPTPRMQYTGESYAKPLLLLINPPSPSHESDHAIKELFPAEREVASHVEDPFEAHLIRPGLDVLLRFFRRFAWIQNGNLQLYILYGLLFLIGVLLWAAAMPR